MPRTYTRIWSYSKTTGVKVRLEKDMFYLLQNNMLRAQNLKTTNIFPSRKRLRSINDEQYMETDENVMD